MLKPLQGGDLQDIEIDFLTVKKKAVAGVVVLTGRTFALSLLSFLATALLTVFLEPSQFGIFWIVSAVVNFFSYFSDIGLAAALIQKKEKLTQSDLSTTFIVQQALVALILLLIFSLSSLFAHFYKLDLEGKILFYALGASLLMSSLKTIPSVLLERRLEFGKLVIPQILENLTYNILAVFLAWQGFGIRSFTYSVLARGFVGLVLMYIIYPWKPSLSFSKKSLISLLKFGLPYQLNTFLATVKDDGLVAFLGGVLGGYGVGLLGWAQKWGQAPLRFFMDQIIKVTFPAFSRIQDNKDELRSALERSLFFISFLVFPSLFGLLATAPLLINLIPKYTKWEPGIIPLYLIGLNTIFASISTQLTNLLNATGRIKTTFKLMVMWTALSWVFIPLFSLKFGVIGASVGYALVGASSIVVLMVVSRFLPFSFSRSFLKPLIASLLMFAAVSFLRINLPVVFWSFWLLLVVGIIVYALIIYVLVGGLILEDVKKSIQLLLGKKV